MNAMLAGILGGQELLLILIVVLLLFGARKIPELMRGMGQGIKEFKKATREVTDELDKAMVENPPPAPKPVPTATVPTAPAPSVSSSQPVQKA